MLIKLHIQKLLTLVSEDVRFEKKQRPKNRIVIVKTAFRNI